MKLKGINPIEQHIEKIVLVVVFTIFLAVLALQFLWHPNRVQIGNAEPVPPERAFDVVEQRAKQVQARMQATPEPLEVALENPADEFRQALAASVAPAPRTTAMGQPVTVEGIGAGAEISADIRVAAVEIPAPTRPVAASFWSTLDPGEVVASEELRKLVPAEQPFDKVAVSVEARFDGAALLEALVSDPDGEEGPLSPLPPNWWRSGLEIVTVSLEREELTPTGEWTDLTTVPAMPGRTNLVAELPKEASVEDMVNLVNDARAFGPAIYRPDFYRTIAGAPWVPPSQAATQTAGVTSPEIDRKLRERADREASIARIDEQLAELGAAPAPSQRSGGGGAKGAGSSGGGTNDDRGASRQNEQRKRTLELQRKRHQDRIAQIDQELRELGYAQTQANGMENTSTTNASASDEQTPLLETPDLAIWAHDLTAEPGKTYRYRIRVGINNPLFGKAPSLDEKQQELATVPVLMSEPSEWTDPVSVLSDSYFFITSASPADQLGPARASAELYRFYYGYYRRGTVTIEPGDVVEGGVKLPDPNLLPIYDITKLAQSTQPSAPARQEQPASPSGGGKGGGAVVTEPAPEEGRSTPVQVVAEGAQPGPRSLTASASMMLLDVTVSPVVTDRSVSGSAKTQFLAYFRGQDGGIAVKTPDEDRSSLYQQLVASARAGESQGQPAAPEQTERPQPRQRDRREPEPPPSSGGGGSTGGG